MIRWIDSDAQAFSTEHRLAVGHDAEAQRVLRLYVPIDGPRMLAQVYGLRVLSCNGLSSGGLVHSLHVDG